MIKYGRTLFLLQNRLKQADTQAPMLCEIAYRNRARLSVESMRFKERLIWRETYFRTSVWKMRLQMTLFMDIF